MNIRPMATAKVRYEEFDGNVELSVTHKSESAIEFMKWIVEATEFYRARLRFETEFQYVRRFIIDYRFGNERGSVIVNRDETAEYSGDTFGL
jgi:hypothetical protein